MQINLGGRVLFWVGRRRNRPITFDDLVEAETRVVDEGERRWELREAMDQALSILGEGECPVSNCAGCEVERAEVRSVLQAALEEDLKGEDG